MAGRLPVGALERGEDHPGRNNEILMLLLFRATWYEAKKADCSGQSRARPWCEEHAQEILMSPKLSPSAPHSPGYRGPRHAFPRPSFSMFKSSK